MITDHLTNAVFFSALLPRKCPQLYEKLHQILSENHVNHRLLSNTKDIWCRDYMPIQAHGNHFVFYKYNPDYLQTPFYKRTITDVNRMDGMEFFRLGKVTDLDLVMDGGNLVKCADKVIMTEKVFVENKDKKRETVIRLLEEAFQCPFIFLPWDENEPLGHSDGIVHYIGDNKVLMTNYADFDPSMARSMRKVLEKHFEVITLSYPVKRKHRRSWAYINFLHVGQHIFIPTMEDKLIEKAFRQITEAFPECECHSIWGCESIVQEGGALNCTTWNVQMDLPIEEESKELPKPSTICLLPNS